MNKLKISSILFLLFLSSSYSISEPTDAEKALLESLPPDQRESAMSKMTKRDSIAEEVEEIFEKENSLIERPELETIEEECTDCIYGYDFFKYSPTTFAPTSDIPIPSDYVLGPGDYLELNFYGSQSMTVNSYISREGIVVLPMLGPTSFLGKTFSQAQEYLNQKAKNELMQSNEQSIIKAGS